MNWSKKITTQYFNELVEINHHPIWPYIPDHPYRILIIGESRSGKTNVLLNLIKQNLFMC